jgi:hypothetical protein
VAYLFLLRKSAEPNLNEYFYNCEKFGCLESERSKTSDITLLNVNEDKNSYSINFDIWDSKTNDINNLSLVIKDSVLNSNFQLSELDISRNFKIQIFYKEIFIPIPHWSKYFQKINFSKKVVTNVEIFDVKTEYSDENNNLDIYKLKESLKESLGLTNDLDKSDYIPTVLFVFDEEVSEGYLKQDDYSQILLSEIIDTAKERKSNDLKNNCQILKKYFPNKECVDYESELKTPLIDKILAFDILHYDISEVLKASVTADSEKVLSTRGNSELWKNYYSNKNVGISDEIRLYMNSFLEYLNYSERSCEDNEYEKTCNDIYRLYEYSKFLTFLSDGNLCSHMSYLPLLSVVTKDESIERELNYILDNYPFESECLYSAGRNGFCSIDLEERFSCMEFLYNTLEYYKDDLEINNILKNVVSDTIDIYLDNYKGRIGIWGNEDINLLTTGTTAEELYPIRYYNIENNYLFYKILEKVYNEK